MTLVPLFCAKFINLHQADEERVEGSIGARFGKISRKFDYYFETMLRKYDRTLSTALLQARGYRVGSCRRLRAISFALPAARRLVLSGAPTPVNS